MNRRTSRTEKRLGALTWFDGLKHLELARVASLVDEVAVPPGRSFGGYHGREVVIVELGTAVERGAASALLGPGAVVGPTGAIALSEVRLLVVSRRALPALLDLAPSLRDALSYDRARRSEIAKGKMRVRVAPRARQQGVATTRRPPARTIPNRGLPT
jgi:hypothetical protein